MKLIHNINDLILAVYFDAFVIIFGTLLGYGE